MCSKRKQKVHPLSDRGFTIIELVVIIAVVAILLGIGIPTYVSWMPDINLGGAVRNIKSDMELAKSTAIRQNTSCAIAFNTAVPGSYTVFVDNGAGGGVANNLVQDGTESTLKSVTMPDHVTLNAANFDDLIDGLQLGFNSRAIPYRNDGTLWAANDGSVVLQNTKNKQKRVRVRAVGSAVVERWTGSIWKRD
jgi:type IV fimbrial biogenesis protein FimT